MIHFSHVSGTARRGSIRYWAGGLPASGPLVSSRKHILPKPMCQIENNNDGEHSVSRAGMLFYLWGSPVGVVFQPAISQVWEVAGWNKVLQNLG